MFSDYEIPYDYLLDAYGGIGTDGKYRSAIADPGKRFAAQLAGNLRGRVAVISFSDQNLRNALAIAIRYGCTRQQFGARLMDYDLHRQRLMPILAQLFAIGAVKNAVF
jgi:acyl-CoA oxidase